MFHVEQCSNIIVMHGLLQKTTCAGNKGSILQRKLQRRHCHAPITAETLLPCTNHCGNTIAMRRSLWRHHCHAPITVATPQKDRSRQIIGECSTWNICNRAFSRGRSLSALLYIIVSYVFQKCSTRNIIRARKPTARRYPQAKRRKCVRPDRWTQVEPPSISEWLPYAVP